MKTYSAGAVCRSYNENFNTHTLMIDIEQNIWGFTSDGEAIILYTIINSVGTSVRTTNLGAAIVSATVCDGEGNEKEIELGSPIFSEYQQEILDFDGVSGRLGAFSKKIWQSRTEVNRVVFAYASPDNDQGMAGELGCEIVYDLNEDNTLEVTCFAACSADTTLNLINTCLDKLVLDNNARLLSGDISHASDTLVKDELYQRHLIFQL